MLQIEDLRMSLRLLGQRLRDDQVIDLMEEDDGPVAGPSTVVGNVENEVAVPVPGPLLMVAPDFLLVPVEEEGSDDETVVEVQVDSV